MSDEGNVGKEILQLLKRVEKGESVEKIDVSKVIIEIEKSGFHVLSDDSYFGSFKEPLSTRYASNEMIDLFSRKTKFTMWRKMWVALAECTSEMGLKNENGELLVASDQVKELKQFVDKINYQSANDHEKEIRHDVMAHVLAFGELCPNAKGIIHLGATSCDITDNAEMSVYSKGLDIIRKRIVTAMYHWSQLALEYKSVPIVGRTHFIAAQPTTLGKRIAMWLEPLKMCLDNIEFLQKELIKAKGLKGAVGTQASYLEICGNDMEKAKELNQKFISKIGFNDDYKTVGQTYPRVIDAMIIESLANVNAVLKKMATDIRLMQGMDQVCEPFGKSQKGSSAMPHKRNPMRDERETGLSRMSFGNVITMLETASEQWEERTLDDSCVRRIIIPQQFMITDASLLLSINVSKGFVVYKDSLETEFKKQVPFMAIEKILMKSVSKGKDRQEIHERLRVHALNSIESTHMGKENPFGNLVCKDKKIGISRKEMHRILEETWKGYGLAEEQVKEFVKGELLPLFARYNHELQEKIEEVKV